MSTGTPPRTPPSPGASPSRTGRLVAAGLGILVFGLLLGFVLTSALRPRMGADDVITGGVVSSTGQIALNPATPPAPQPGGAAPGGEPTAASPGEPTAAPPAGPRAAPPGDPAAPPPAPSGAELEALARRAEQAPADVEAQLRLVRAAVDANRGDLALPALDRVLARHPKHPAALTYLGLMTAAQGRVDHGLELIDEALRAAPGDPFALWARGGLLFSHRRDYAAAAAAWEAMLGSPRLDAATRAAVQDWVAEARWRAEQGEELPRAGAARGEAPATRGEAPAARGTTGAAAGAPLVSGTVRLAPGVGQADARAGALFVIARRGPGPPLAVKRIEAPRFPVTYTLGPEDAMLPGRPVEGDLEIVARLSRSGTAGPARAGDLEGRFGRNPVKPGATGVDIVLAPVAGGQAK